MKWSLYTYTCIRHFTVFTMEGSHSDGILVQRLVYFCHLTRFLAHSITSFGIRSPETHGRLVGEHDSAVIIWHISLHLGKGK